MSPNSCLRPHDEQAETRLAQSLPTIGGFNRFNNHIYHDKPIKENIKFCGPSIVQKNDVILGDVSRERLLPPIEPCTNPQWRASSASSCWSSDLEGDK